MSVLKKLQKVRVKLSELPLKKSGHNAFSKYYYFELSDFLPSAQLLMEKEGLAGVFDIDENKATLQIFDTDVKDESASFSCNVKEATMKGAQPTQNLGATITYIRRYLWINVLELTEADALDGLKQDLEAQEKLKQLSPEEQKAHAEELKKQHEISEKKQKIKHLRDFLSHKQVALGSFEEGIIKDIPEILNIVQDRTLRTPMMIEWMGKKIMKSTSDVGMVDKVGDFEKDFLKTLELFKSVVKKK